MKDSAVDPPDRRRAADTRSAVIDAARTLFARYPYPEVTVKRIADQAGVSAPLVIKYFESKEKLLLAATNFRAELNDFLDSPLPDLARCLVTSLVNAHAAGVDPLLAFLYIGGRQGAPSSSRDALQVQFIDKLAGRLEGHDTRLRAELCCAELVGVSAVRRLGAGAALGSLSQGQLTELLLTRIAPLIDGTAPTRP